MAISNGLFVVPVSMFGGGIYSMSAVKEIRATSAFYSLRDDQKQCQQLGKAQLKNYDKTLKEPKIIPKNTELQGEGGGQKHFSRKSE